MQKSRTSLILSVIIYIFTTLLGIFAFIYPFVIPSLASQNSAGQSRAAELPLAMTILLILCILVIFIEVQQQAVTTKVIALLGILIAINASLRFIEVAIPGPAGFSPIFFLIILTGYVYGGMFGFLMGSLTILISALITGGIGPWLPSQMIAAGWVGMTAPLCKVFTDELKIADTKWELGILSVFSLLWGFLFGAIMNLWSWPFIMGPTSQSWSPDMTFLETLKNYLFYYLITSFTWDSFRAIGNILFILFLGAPTLKVLRRFQQRFTFKHVQAADFNKKLPVEEL